MILSKHSQCKKGPCFFSFYTNCFLLGFGRRLSDHPGIQGFQGQRFLRKNNNSKPFSKTFSYRLHDCSKDISEIFIIFKLDKLIMIHVQKFVGIPFLHVPMAEQIHIGYTNPPIPVLLFFVLVVEWKGGARKK